MNDEIYEEIWHDYSSAFFPSIGETTYKEIDGEIVEFEFTESGWVEV